MSQIVLFKNEDGNVQRATDFENVDRCYITDKIQKHTNLVAKWESALAVYDSITGEGQPAEVPAAAPEEVAAPVEPTPEVPATPEQPTPETPAPTEVPNEPAQPEPAPTAPVDETPVTEVPAPTPLQ